jgi:hypothetical protein
MLIVCSIEKGADDVGIERHRAIRCGARGGGRPSARLPSSRPIRSPTRSSSMQRWPVAVTTPTSSARDSGFAQHARR